MQKVEIPVPVPKECEILVKVEAVSLNPCDWKIQSGLMKPSLPKFPFVPCKIYIYIFFSETISWLLQYIMNYILDLKQ